MINSQTYTIGTDPGCYPIGNSLTDSFIGLSEVSVVIMDRTSYIINDFSQLVNTITLLGELSFEDGDKVTLIFKNSINIGC